MKDEALPPDNVDSRLARVEEIIKAEKELRVALREADQKAITEAFLAATNLAEKHNDLIRAGQQRDELYARADDLKRVEQNVLLSVPQRVYDQKHEALVDKIGDLERWRANVTGRGVAIVTLGGIAVASISGLIVHLLGG